MNSLVRDVHDVRDSDWLKVSFAASFVFSRASGNYLTSTRNPTAVFCYLANKLVYI